MLVDPQRAVAQILTIEDPVEYEIPGINQSQVKPSIGLTFASAMRVCVRQDPNVIMVGEVRDAEPRISRDSRGADRPPVADDLAHRAAAAAWCRA